jgi:hypothetical protein
MPDFQAVRHHFLRSAAIATLEVGVTGDLQIKRFRQLVGRQRDSPLFF